MSIKRKLKFKKHNMLYYSYTTTMDEDIHWTLVHSGWLTMRKCRFLDSIDQCSLIINLCVFV